MTPITLSVAADQPGPRISRHIFGQFAEHLGRCVYEGLWVGEDSPIPNVRGIRKDVVAALREIRVPNIRWPGGCFADAYHWRDGIGPREKRPRLRNHTWGIDEPNTFGTHEFIDLCRQVGAEPVICGNVGSGTVREMRDWVEYLNAPVGAPLPDERAANGHPEPFGVRYWGVGNENWGCGGTMRAEYYADEFRRYATFIGGFGGATFERIACGPCVDDTHWTEVMMRECASPRFHPEIMHGLSLHYYVNGGPRPDFLATRFDHDGWRLAMAHAWRMEALLREHAAIMDRHDPKQRISLVVDEWGSWYAPEPGARANELFQQQTIRDAVLAALTLHCFIARAERVRMANIAQMINVLQAMLLTWGDRMVRTPTWHVFRLYRVHHDARRLPVTGDAGTLAHEGMPYPRLSASASLADDGAVAISLTNTEPDAAVPVELFLTGRPVSRPADAWLLAAPVITDCNTPEAPDRVAARPWEGLRGDSNSLHLVLPPGSVAVLTFSSV